MWDFFAKGSSLNKLVRVASLMLLSSRSGVEAVNHNKVSFQIFEIDSPLIDIMWCGNTNDIILVQTEQGTIYRSRDRGDSWKKLHSIMHQTGMSVVDDGQTVSSQPGKPRTKEGRATVRKPLKFR